MSMSARTLETLIDLVEIKLSCTEVIDREGGQKYVAHLECCRSELKNALSNVVVAFPGKGKRKRAAV